MSVTHTQVVLTHKSEELVVWADLLINLGVLKEMGGTDVPPWPMDRYITGHELR